ncbi:MAG: serine hydrolase [Acidobacteria bacterium]|nr:serine hydrolase [Acidobacteriota bacterium]
MDRVYRLNRREALATAAGLLGFGSHTPTRSAQRRVREGGSGPRLAELDRMLGEQVEKGFAGSVLVARGREVLHLAGYGLADREAGVPFRPETVSTIGSITKQFTGAAILKLQEQGHLNAGDSVGRFFPEAPARKRAITIHQLLTHTAGLPPALGSDEEYVGRDDYLQEVWRTELRYPPGERHDYSNTGYSVLAAIVERSTGRPYEEFLRGEFFEPLGMHHTGYRLADWSEAHVAAGYRDGRRFGRVIQKQNREAGFSWHLVGNGGIHSTVEDMFRWVKALRGGEVLSAESLGTLFGEHVDEGYGDSFYGYGWVTFQLPSSERMIGHNGGNGFFFADLNFFPNRGDLLYCVLMNDAGHEEVSRTIRQLLLEQPPGARSQEDPQ